MRIVDVLVILNISCPGMGRDSKFRIRWGSGSQKMINRVCFRQGNYGTHVTRHHAELIQEQLSNIIVNRSLEDKLL